jgi:hypothetical protein
MTKHHVEFASPSNPIRLCSWLPRSLCTRLHPSPLFVALPGAPFGPFLAVLLAVGVLVQAGRKGEDEAAQECWKE